jgi:hypothetical protein
MAVSCLVLFSPVVVRAGLIPIVNAGFEDPALVDGHFTLNSIPGWTGVGPEWGVYNPGSAVIPGEAPEGANVAYIVGSGEIYQTLTAALTQGSYHLSLQVGDAFGYTSPYEVQLRAGGSILAQASTPVPGDGTFTLVNLDYIASAGDPLLGQFLEIRFRSTGSDRTAQPFFDDVRLNFNAVPEPSGLVLLGTGLSGLCLCLRRRRQNSAVSQEAVSEETPSRVKRLGLSG